MNVTDFTKSQLQAFLDLLMLAMYADGQLCSAEDERVERLFSAIGIEPGYDREREFDASVTRVRRHSQNADVMCVHAAELARSFSTPTQRRTVYELLKDLIGSDDQISANENRLLSAVREVFQL
jgi:uncharacterized tellurite resistance protein B-like protein